MNNFTPRAQQVLALARKEADRFNHNYIGTEHVLLGIIRLGQGVAVNVLMKLGLDLETVRIEVEKQVGAGPDRTFPGNIPYTPRVKKILALAGKEAKQLNHSYVGTEHILLGLLREGDGVSARVLRTLEVDLERTRDEILKELDPNFASGSYPERRQLGGTSPSDPAYYYTGTAPPSGEFPPIRRQQTPVPSGDVVPPHPAIRPYLNHGEVLLWSGAPIKKFRLERWQLPLLLFMVPFFAFMMFILVMSIIAPSSPPASANESAQVQQGPTVTAAPESTSQKPPPLIARIFIAAFAFCFVGSIMAWIFYCGGFTLGGNTFLQGETLYGVTNQRVIIVAGKKSKTVRSIHLGSVTDLRMKQWPDGLGSISAGPESSWPYPSPTRGTNTLLENIAEPARVFKIMIDVRKLA
ncbi:MAG TPA: Clp protease N-terminal domain-containing protein [Candidatus Methylacidiphilales bacterium]|jgi:hypothetical protein|nr:Clp protease N-terminal domain-containing protein [Candidatus Methylacidiphilales bacterium]